MLRSISRWLADAARPHPAVRTASRELPHYWINPDAATGRAAWMREQLERARVTHHRIRARTPDDLPPLALPARHDATELQLACLASHFAAIERALGDGAETFVVLEDDMTLPFDVDFRELVGTAPADWEILQLYVVNAERLQAMYAGSYRRSRLWRRWHPKNHSTGAYICSRQAAQKLVARFVRAGALDLSRYRGLLVADDLIYRCARTYTATYPLYIENDELGTTLNSLRRLHVAAHAAIREIWRDGAHPPYAALRD